MKSERFVSSYRATATAGIVAALICLSSLPLASAARNRECLGRRVTVVGTSRGDDLRGTSGADVIAGLAGNDVIRGLGDEDVLCGGPGYDDLDGGGDHDELDGGRGDDTLSGASGNDVLSGASGSDWMRGRGGDDSILGGAGLDTLDFESASRSIDADLARGSAQGEGRDLLKDLEALFGSRFDDVLVGDQRANYLQGRGGDDELDGGSGMDMVISYSDASVEIDLASGLARETNPFIPGDSPSEDSLEDIESAMGGYHDDQISGDDGPNILIGLAGEDILDGRGDDDIFFTEGFGNGPNDYGFSWPTGGDRVQGGSGAADLVDFSVVPAWIDADLAAGTATANCNAPTDEQDPHCGGTDSLAGTEWLRGAEQYWYEASGWVSAPDRLTGDEGPNAIFGMDGDDELAGGAGNDYLSGGKGSDRLDGQEGEDACVGGQQTLNCESQGRPLVHPLEAVRLLWTKLRFE